MTDDNNTAQEILTRVLGTLNSEENGAFEVTDDNGWRCLIHRFQSDHGGIAIVYYPVGLIEWLLAECEDLIDEVLTTARIKHLASGAEGRISKIEPNERAGLARAIVETIMAPCFLHNLREKLPHALAEVDLETRAIIKGALPELINKALADPHHELIVDSDPRAEIKTLAREMVNERSAFLKGMLERVSMKPQLEKLPELYPTLLSIWQSAKKIYADNIESETWRAMVRAKYPEITFDDDLLTRITGKSATWPEEIRAKAEEKDGDHTPHTIALEHAARMCGATPYQFGVRYLLKLAGIKTEQSETE